MLNCPSSDIHHKFLFLTGCLVPENQCTVRLDYHLLHKLLSFCTPMHPIHPNSILNTKSLTVNRLDTPVAQKTFIIKPFYTYSKRLPLTIERVSANLAIRTFYGITIARNTFKLDHFPGNGLISSVNSLDERFQTKTGIPLLVLEFDCHNCSTFFHF